MKKNFLNLLVTTTLVFSLPTITYAQNASLKDLTDIEVTSVSKRTEKASEAAAAIFVITQEDIRKSGATSIPEVLRMVPGIQVARIDSNKWAITSRGFARDFANKLLVLIDGRSIYNPLFSGVIWDEQSTMLEDIERIEVIRGPGATLWGANAVNGVINIITKSAESTQGTLAIGGYGNTERAFGKYRYGGKVGDNNFYRTYAEHIGSEDYLSAAKTEKEDHWHANRAGFKVEHKAGTSDNLTVQGDVYEGDRNEPFDNLPSLTFPYTTSQQDTHKFNGGNLLAKYTKQFSEKSTADLQIYYDYTNRQLQLFGQKIGTLDLDFQHSYIVNSVHELIWGLGYRNINFDLERSLYIDLAAANLQNNKSLYSSFVQDKITLIPLELYLTLGSKFEKNDYTNFEIQPNVRLLWLPSEKQTVWASIARAVRTPSYFEAYVHQLAQGTPFGYLGLIGNQDFESEKLTAYEIGYRIQPKDNLSLDFSTFYNDYDELRSFELGAPIPPIALAYYTDNLAYGRTYGFETSGKWQPTKKLTLSATYSYLNLDVKYKSGSTDIISAALDYSNAPHNMFNIRSSYEITDNLEINNALYYNGNLPGIGVNKYYRLDAGITWKPMDSVELSLTGQNLLDDSHQEFSAATYNTVTEIPRSVYGKVMLKF